MLLASDFYCFLCDYNCLTLRELVVKSSSSLPLLHLAHYAPCMQLHQLHLRLRQRFATPIA